MVLTDTPCTAAHAFPNPLWALPHCRGVCTNLPPLLKFQLSTHFPGLALSLSGCSSFTFSWTMKCSVLMKMGSCVFGKSGWHRTWHLAGILLTPALTSASCDLGKLRNSFLGVVVIISTVALKVVPMSKSDNTCKVLSSWVDLQGRRPPFLAWPLLGSFT